MDSPVSEFIASVPPEIRAKLDRSDGALDVLEAWVLLKFTSRALLNEMNSWDEVEQENMIAHWEGHNQRAKLTKQPTVTYGWKPRYRIEG